VFVATTARWRSLRGLTTAITVFLGLFVATAVFAIVAYGNRISVTNDILDNRFDFGLVGRAQDADDLVSAARSISLLLSLVLLVLIIIWTYRAMKNNEALGRPYPRLKPGWGIAGWLIPFANLVIPVLILQDLWRGSEVSTPRGDPNWRSNGGSALVGWYWGVFLVSNLRNGSGSTSDENYSRSYFEDIRTSDQIALAGMVASVAAAVLGILVVRRIAERQEACLRAQQQAWQAAAAGPPPA
jgi:ABC-type Fe3+ transport system permease subunit